MTDDQLRERVAQLRKIASQLEAMAAEVKSSRNEIEAKENPALAMAFAMVSRRLDEAASTATGMIRNPAFA